jgi:hypothetical protein
MKSAAIDHGPRRDMFDNEGGQELYSVFDKAQTVDPEVRAHVYSLVTAVSDLANEARLKISHCHKSADMLLARWL